jgi:drug/metabolite transporter (DMT)-like permease
MLRAFPLIFVVLWASAFITGKVIVQDASPFASLGFRFAIVALGFLIFALIMQEKLRASLTDILEAGATGVLFHGLYLGGVFFAISKGMPAGMAALLVSLQPVLTGALAGPVLGEQVTWRQWLGIALGFGGAAAVLGLDIGASFPIIAFASVMTGLIAVTGGTLWQKKLSGKLSLSVSNFYQALAACFFHLGVMTFFETPFIYFTPEFIYAMSWQILAVSFGAFTILMYLIKIGSASQTATLFFLVPPVSAVMGYLFLGEALSVIDILGLIAATIGVYIATSGPSAAAR